MASEELREYIKLVESLFGEKALREGTMQLSPQERKRRVELAMGGDGEAEGERQRPPQQGNSYRAVGRTDKEKNRERLLAKIKAENPRMRGEGHGAWMERIRAEMEKELG